MTAARRLAAVALICCFVAPPSARAQVQTVGYPPGVSAVVPGGERLRRFKAAPIFLVGADTLRIRVAQDALGMELRRLGVPVVDQSRVDKALGDEETRLLRTAQAADRPGAAGTESRSAQAASTVPADITALAKSLGWDAVITGTLVEEVFRTEEITTVKTGALTRNKIVERSGVVLASLNVVDVLTGDLLFSAVVTLDGEGASIPEAARVLAKTLEVARATAK